MRRWVLVPLVASGLAVVINLITDKITMPGGWWLWVVFGLLLSAAVLLEFTGRPRAAGSLQDATADLAARVERDWSAEAVRREITRPDPVLVSWSSTGRPAAGREAVMGEGSWQQFPLRGSTDSLNADILAAFRCLRHGQLMVLGGPGAGKSGFALLLTLALIRSRKGSAPVPVLLAISEWDPAESVADFVTGRVAAEYGNALGAHGEPRAIAARLMEHGLILPVLDGLDEVHRGTTEAALRALEIYASARRPVVVTCRGREYEQAALRSETVLAGAAVVELERVGVESVIAFLSYPELARPRWETVFTHLRGHPHGPLANALSTPLMVSLARATYQDPATDPAGLLEISDESAVRAQLMSSYLDGVYGRRPRRWLGTLASLLEAMDSRQLQFGVLAYAPLRLTARWTYVRMTAVMQIVAGSAAAALSAVAGLNPWAAFVTGAAAVYAVQRRGLWPLAALELPGGFWLRHPRAPGFLTRWVAGIAGCALAVGWITGQWVTALLAAPPSGAVMATVLTLPVVVRIDRIWGTNAQPAFLSLRYVLALPITAGAPICLLHAGAATMTGSSPMAAGITAATVYGGTIAVGGAGWYWFWFRATHAWYALRGRLPWFLRAFLADAGRRGVLRRTGPAYEFRHAVLQDHLADVSR
ncbi:hypothetical protein ACTI_76620 [Actinoplanes sp. OR16]|uniref:hypothetical protein n=1 Tax=Actinoplanes sp. OR16 TaxID=946334 RepID=UPI000F7049E0|nr:hypothetical protein [Actinoplanes sp. OR16]BBH70977.1 hypothetical protein ACTI_76620 [Actinoplanes sp. OR16]